MTEDEKYTLDTDFSTLNGPKADSWMLGFRDMVDAAFANCDNRTKLLGHLLIIEQYVHTLRQGLSGSGEQPSDVLQHALDLLWSYLEADTAPTDFQDFANNIFASAVAYNTGDDLTEAQQIFYNEQFGNTELSAVEWQIISWISELLITLVASGDGRLDFDVNTNELESYKQISFLEIEELLGVLTDACIDFTNTPLLSSRAGDYAKAEMQVYQTPLFRQIVTDIVSCLKTALAATPAQYAALREKYRQCTFIPEEYAADLMEF